MVGWWEGRGADRFTLVHSQIQTFLEQQHQRAVLPDAEFISIVWNGLLSSGEIATKSVDQVMKEITVRCPPPVRFPLFAQRD